MAALHPDVDHNAPLRELRAEANELAERAPELARDELVVGLLRLTTLGERDGHGGIFLHLKSDVPIRDRALKAIKIIGPVATVFIFLWRNRLFHLHHIARQVK